MQCSVEIKKNDDILLVDMAQINIETESAARLAMAIEIEADAIVQIMKVASTFLFHGNGGAVPSESKIEY